MNRELKMGDENTITRIRIELGGGVVMDTNNCVLTEPIQIRADTNHAYQPPINYSELQRSPYPAYIEANILIRTSDFMELLEAKQ